MCGPVYRAIRSDISIVDHVGPLDHVGPRWRVREKIHGITHARNGLLTVEKVVERLNKQTKGWGAFYSVGYPSKAFNAVNGYALRRMARFLNRKSQRHYRLKFADTYYGELNHYGMHWLRWADVRRRRY